MADELPQEVLRIIFKFVNPDSLFTLPKVCRKWRNICETLHIQMIQWKDYDRLSIDQFISMCQRFENIKVIKLNISNRECNNSHKLLLEKKFKNAKIELYKSDNPLIEFADNLLMHYAKIHTNLFIH